MRSSRIVALLAPLVLFVTPVVAGTFVFLDSRDGDWLGGGKRLYMAAPDYEVTVSRGPGAGVNVRVDGPDWWFLDFFLPVIARIEPGVYENAVEPGSPFVLRPKLFVSGDGRACSRVTGRFVVLDVAYDAQNNVVRLAIDFEQRCNGDPAVLVGSIRFAAGDEQCAGAADGSPCDDRDACTGVANCAAGRCVGGERTACASDVGPCREPGVCSPVDGRCTAAQAKPYASACDDGDACTETQCRDGECVPIIRVDCNDASACTDDFCDPVSGCQHLPVPGECGVPGSSGTRAFVRELHDDPADRGTVQDSDRGDGPAFGGAYFGEPFNGTVALAFDNGYFGPQSFTFGSASGEPLRPGVYENASAALFPGERAGRPLLRASVSTFCDDGVGRFIVHEAAYGQATELVAFAVDFELACENGARRFAGAVRWRAGSSACTGAADGSPCDDRDACTATSACRGGVCVGDGAEVCDPLAEDCVATNACDPSNGQCVAGAAQDDLGCTAPLECIPAGVCMRGRCRTPRPPCDDVNPCTVDRCEAATCVNEPVAGTCWKVRTRTKVGMRTARGTSCKCTLQTERFLLALADDGAVFGERPGCEDTPGSRTDAVHAWTPGKRGRLDLALDPIGRCGALVFPLDDFAATAWVKVRQQELTGVQTQRWSPEAGGAARSVSRLTGRRTDGRTMPPPTPWRSCQAMERCWAELSGE